MPDKDYLTELVGFQGSFVKGMQIEREKDVDKVVIDLGRNIFVVVPPLPFA